MNSSVLIIILNYNKPIDTIDCVDSVLYSDYNKYHVLLIDNCSVDDSVQHFKGKYINNNNIIILNNSANMGYTGGNNLGIEYAIRNNYSYVWLLNNDTIVEINTLSELIDIMEMHKDVGMISPIIYYYKNKNTIQNMGDWLDIENFTIRPIKAIDELNKKINDIFLWGTALLIRIDVIKKIGGLDNRFFAYLEDADISKRVLDAGYKNMISINSKIYHKDSVTTGSKNSDIQLYLRSRNMYLFWKKHLNWYEFIKYIKHYLLYIINRSINIDKLGIAGNYIYKGFWAAISNKYGKPELNCTVPKIFLWSMEFIKNNHPNMIISILFLDFKYIFKYFKNKYKADIHE